jgi:hypothetical protein
MNECFHVSGGKINNESKFDIHDSSGACACKLGDSDLQDFIEDQVPVLRKHLNKARDIQKDLKEDSSSPQGSAPSKTPNR